MKFNISIPAKVADFIEELQKLGHSGYLVGDCVRDLFSDRAADCFRIVTSAAPEAVLAYCEGDDRLAFDPLGKRITFVRNGTGFEIVSHNSGLIEYLGQQDFTINAMAFHDQEGLIDPWNGREDMEVKRIKCVGPASESYKMDALRIVKAIRYASQLDFTICIEDRQEILNQCENLNLISLEYVRPEFCKLMCTDGISTNLRAYKKVFLCLLPELKDMLDFPQNNPFHVYDVFEHTVHAMEQCGSDDLIVRLAVFFHDFGKPHSFQDGQDGVRHFKGHGRVSADITEKIMKRFGFDSEMIHNVVQLVYYHDATFQVGHKYIRRWINKIGIQQYRRLLEIRKADIKGQNPNFESKRLNKVEILEMLLDQAAPGEPVFTRKDLAVSGSDLIEIGYKPGKEIGVTLQRLLDCVIADKTENKKEILLQLAKEAIDHRDAAKWLF